MSDWLESMFSVTKPVIGMLHLAALPGDPDFDRAGGMREVVDRARAELRALQDGGIDGVLISNEFSLPYLTRTEPVTATAMGRVVGELLGDVEVPFGVNVLWDGLATLDLAVATDAAFVREVYSGVYASDFGLWDTNPGQTARHRARLGAHGVRMLYNIVPESAAYLVERDLDKITRTTVFATRPDGLCISGVMAGDPTDTLALNTAKSMAGDVPVFVNTGVSEDNIEIQLGIADGAIVGTFFKRDGQFANQVDQARVERLMSIVRTMRTATS